MNDNIQKQYFEAAGELLAAGLVNLKAEDPQGYQAVSALMVKGGIISLTASIAGSGIGEVRCVATLGEDEALLFSIDAKAQRLN